MDHEMELRQQVRSSIDPDTAVPDLKTLLETAREWVSALEQKAMKGSMTSRRVDFSNPEHAAIFEAGYRLAGEQFGTPEASQFVEKNLHRLLEIGDIDVAYKIKRAKVTDPGQLKFK